MGARRRRRAYARTLGVGALSIGLGFGASLTGAPDAGAGSGEFSNGKATAFAQVARLAPGIGSLQLATSMGTTVSQVSNTLAQAQAHSLDLGLVGTALTAEKCNGDPGSLTQEDLPAATQADNRKGDAAQVSDEYPAAGSTIGGGREEVRADSVPSAQATVTNVAAGFGPVVGLSGGRSDSITRVVEGAAREAEATVSVDIDIAGIIQLRDARWRALHRTGSDPAVDGTFTVASASAGSVPLPIDMMPLEDAINGALALSGITVEFPRVEHVTSPNDFVRVTPMRVTLKDTPVGKAALGPVLNLSRTQREQLFDEIMKIECQLAGALLVGDIGISIVSGTGFMIVDIGGSEASSAEVTLENPFGIDSPFALPELDNTIGAVTGGQLATAAVPGTPGSPGTGAAIAGSSPVSAVGPLERLCETLHPSKGPSCSHGMGVPIGLAGLALTSGIAFLDWRRQRRLVDVEPSHV